MNSRGISTFRRFGIVNIIAILLVILAGGVVRTTGSGMGCPDWPKCFGQVVPPTDESQLPPDWKERYSNSHGYIAEFNPVETWIEYLNRLLGALIGVFTLVIAVLSLSYRKVDRTVTWLSFLSLLIVILEGVVGKMVVDHNLDPSFVSFHFYGSLVVILLMIFIVARARQDQLNAGDLLEREGLKKWSAILLMLTMIQIYLGTRVRHQIDIISIASDYMNREVWIDFAGIDFLVHRSFSILIVLANAYFYLKLKKEQGASKLLGTVSVVIIGLLMLELATGIIMNYFSIPAAAQPMHMLIGTMLLSAQFLLWVLLSQAGLRNIESK